MPKFTADPLPIANPLLSDHRHQLNTKVYSFKLEPINCRWRRPNERTDLRLMRVGLRCHDDDRDEELRIGVNGSWFRYNVGLLHDAYDGKGVFGSGRADNQELVGQFGEVLARINELVCKIDGREAPTTYPPRAMVLGAAMLTLSDALDKLQYPAASGFPFIQMINVVRTDALVVECGGLRHPLQVHLLACERAGARRMYQCA